MTRRGVFNPELGSPDSVASVAEETTMKDAQTYREYAADCMRMAQLLKGGDREALVNMAKAWEERAQEIERRAKKTGD
jgi:hypothetical protein